MRDVAKFSGWALALILIVSFLHELAYLTRGINKLDESWQLYTAMRLHAGGVLYDDALWVFPPAHVWTAWLAWWLDPPGLVLSRAIYSAFNLALCAGIYVLALRLMPPPFAVLAGLLVALAAPRGHSYQLLFGFRYLIFPVLALIAVDRRFRGGAPGWMVAAGALVGVAVTFRLTPAFSVSCGIAVALVAFYPRWRDWFDDGLRFAAGLLATIAPVLLWFALSVGLGRMWQEVVVHPLAMLQPLPLPTPDIPEVWTRDQLSIWFVAIQFRAIWVLYFSYLAGLVALWVRARRRGEPFEHGLLTALVVFGLIFFIRSTGRSDEPHLDSVIPPACLVVAHLLSLAFGRLWPPERGRAGLRRLGAGVFAAGALATWVFLLNVDEVFLRPKRMRQIEAVGGRIATPDHQEAWAIDHVVKYVGENTEPDDTILNLAPSPMFHILTNRTGPGYFDVMMPGIFLTDEDETWFLDRLKASPPAIVIWPALEFDGRPDRNIKVVAPRVSAWVRARYKVAPGKHRRYIVYVLKDD